MYVPYHHQYNFTVPFVLDIIIVDTSIGIQANFEVLFCTGLQSY